MIIFSILLYSSQDRKKYLEARYEKHGECSINSNLNAYNFNIMRAFSSVQMGPFALPVDGVFPFQNSLHGHAEILMTYIFQQAVASL